MKEIQATVRTLVGEFSYLDLARLTGRGLNDCLKAVNQMVHNEELEAVRTGVFVKKIPTFHYTPKAGASECRICGRMFAPKHLLQKYCGATCNATACERMQKKYHKTFTRLCSVCGKQFTSSGRKPRQTCSKECRDWLWHGGYRRKP